MSPATAKPHTNSVPPSTAESPSPATVGQYQQNSHNNTSTTTTGVNDSSSSYMNDTNGSLNVSSIPPFELKKLVQQTLTLQKQVQMAQKSAHNKMIGLQKEIDELSSENYTKTKKIKKLETKIKHIKKKNEDHAGMIAKLKPYKAKYQQLTLQNAELNQKLHKYKDGLNSSSSGHLKPQNSSSKLHNYSFGAGPGASNDRHGHLERRSSSSSIREDGGSPSHANSSKRDRLSDNRRQSLDTTSRRGSTTLTSPLNHFPPLSTVLNDFNAFNNALMDFLDAITHLSIFDSCYIVHSVIVACQQQIDQTFEQSSDKILDSLYSAHFPGADSKNTQLFKREQLKQSKAFQSFLKQFRQIEYQNLLDKQRLSKQVVQEMMKQHADKEIPAETFEACITSILPIVWNFSLKGLTFKSNEQQELKGKTWDIAKYDLLDSGSERGEEITVVVRPSLVRSKSGKEVRKALVCCASVEE